MRVCVVEGVPLVRYALTRLLDAHPRLSVVGNADRLEDLLPEMRRLRPGLLMLDLSLVCGPALPSLRDLRSALPELRLITLALPHERRHIAAALELGVSGLLFKDATPELVLKCVHCVLAGEYWMGRRVIGEMLDEWRCAVAMAPHPECIDRRPFQLTPRELQVVSLIVAGLANRDIAEQLVMSSGTVKHHLTRIFDKTGVSTRLALSAFAARHGLGGEPAMAGGREPRDGSDLPMLKAEGSWTSQTLP